jgi:imidazolonepropionase-like amidohydrolase
MNYTLIHNGTVIDGNGRDSIPNGAVLVKDNRIQAVGRSLQKAENIGLVMLDGRVVKDVIRHP